MLTIKDFPQGFANNLMQDSKATDFFFSCNVAQKQALLSQVQKITSKEEMKAFVENLPSLVL